MQSRDKKIEFKEKEAYFKNQDEISKKTYTLLNRHDPKVNKDFKYMFDKSSYHSMMGEMFPRYNPDDAEKAKVSSRNQSIIKSNARSQLTQQPSSKA